MPASPRLATFRRRLPLLVALAFTACLGDCKDPMSESARKGEPQVLVRVTSDTAFNRELPAVVYRDSLRVVRILADTLRLYPGQLRYRRNTVYGVATGDGPEVRLPPTGWVTRTLYEVKEIIDWHVVLDSFDIAPGVPPGSATWDTYTRDTAWVQVSREPRTRPDSSYFHTEAYNATWVPARRK